MKKNFFILFALMIFISTSLHAQVNFNITENSYQKINISFTFGALKTVDVATDSGFFSRIYMDGCAGSSNIGEPELPVAVNTLEIPICEDYVLNVYGKEYEIVDASALGILYPAYPAQPSVSKSHEGPVVFVQNKNVYQTDAFYALPLAKFEMIGTMRNLNLGQLYVSPVQYNPVTKEIKIYKSLDVEILFKKPEFVKTRIIKDLHDNPLFRPSNIINGVQNNGAGFSNTPIKYLIVAHAMFRGALDEFIAWKKRKGFLVEIGYTDESNVGTTTTSISAFIKSHYHNATTENPAPTFVLLVGDVEQIPAFNGQEGTHPTDLYYFTWAGGNLPCCYYGRFSAQNLGHLIPQIQKTLQYEQFAMPDPNYLDNICLIAGYDATYASVWGNGLVNYITNYYATAEYGYKNVFKHLYPNSSQQAALIREEIGAGVGIANYTAHGAYDRWTNPSFLINDIKNMKNENKYGLMIGNCCYSNQFNLTSDCFGEALLRAAGKGAVGYIGGSDETWWNEDYYWGVGFRTTFSANPTYNAAQLGTYDRLFHAHGENYNVWATTFGAMIKAGNEAVQTSTSSLKKYYWEIYHLMGDPSIMTYLTKPAQMTTVTPNEIKIGTTTFTAKTAPYAYCALTYNGKELIGAGFADANGEITLHFNSIEKNGNCEFAAWAQNYIQFFKTINIVPQSVAHYFSSFSLFPNPTTGELTIDNEQLTINNVEVFDVYGRKVLEQKSRKAEEQKKNSPPFMEGWTRSGRGGKEGWQPQADGMVINISNLASGIYVVKIFTEQGEIIKKIVKQ